jgi:ABC-type lipoprotein export system ATPase subunit
VPPVLRFESVTKRYSAGEREVLALDGVDLEIDEGQLVSLVGRSGSGKSTLLHLAGGLDVADAGRVLFDGRDVGALSVADRGRLRRREVGFVFQFFHLIPTLTVLENVELPLLLDGAKRGERGFRLLERVGLLDRAHHLPGELSGGEMQRAAVARALVARPRLILADEPTGNLDSANGAEVLRLLREEVREEGTTLLMVTHDDEAAAQADRRHRLVDGRLVVEGPAAASPFAPPAEPPGEPAPPTQPTPAVQAPAAWAPPAWAPPRRPEGEPTP